MPSQQAAKTSKRGAAATGARKQPASRPAPRATREGQTGASDESYALISVLYHVLQGADTLDQYIQDARAANDQELASFFEETREAYAERAEQGKLLLAERLASAQERGGEEEEEEEDEDEDDEED
jgi:hypothetical protein